MESNLPMPGPSPEKIGQLRQDKQPFISNEHLPMPETTEVQARTPEHQEAPKGAPVEPVVAPVAAQPSLPVPNAPVHPVAAAQPQDDTNPPAASDIDLIEKEWVDKAKSIVKQTRNDPYAQEQEVSRLQADYIKKRYGKDIKTAD